MYTLRLVDAVKGLTWTSAALCEQLSNPEFQAESTAHQLINLLTQVGKKKATVRHDYIYGLLGMLDAPVLSPHLVPDYSLPYASVFADYTRFLVEQVGDLRLLLGRTNYLKQLKGVPS